MDCVICTTPSKTTNGSASPEKDEQNHMSITNNTMIFVFAFFAYAFQDSMDDLIVFAMKNIVVCLSYMFNFNGDIRLLQYTQLLINYFSGMLEGQVAPSSVSYSLHANEHLAESILCHRPPVDNNTINQERQYKTIKIECSYRYTVMG